MTTPDFFTLSDEENEQINNCFTHYLFYSEEKNGDRNYICSHCGEKFTVPFCSRMQTHNDYQLLQCGHNQTISCPKCGVWATAKHMGKARECRTLTQLLRIVLIRPISENLVQVRCFEAKKDFSYKTYVPSVELWEASRYELSPGKSVQYRKGYYDSWHQSKVASEPFQHRTSFAFWQYVDNSYIVLGLNRLKDSFLKYNMLDNYENLYAQHHSGGIVEIHYMRYLCRFAEHPQMEMLQKLGYYKIVESLVECNIKNFPYVNWKAKTIYDFFKLTKAEFNEFRKIGGDLEFIKFKKAVFNLTGNGSVRNTEPYFNAFKRIDYFELAKEKIVDNRVPFMEGIKYLIRVINKGTDSVYGTIRFYDDYLKMGRELKLDLKNPVVLYPKNLMVAHDTATRLHNAYLQEQREKEQKKRESKAKVVLAKFEKQYSFKNNDFVIIVPKTISEIITEGKLQQHCVGGYADRHLEGKLAILFLRSAKEPDKPLYTIEMHNKSLSQVQGFHNRTPLTSEAKKFFEMWLSWVRKGSRRDENGAPIIEHKILKTA